jgi:hypothetical protein
MTLVDLTTPELEVEIDASGWRHLLRGGARGRGRAPLPGAVARWSAGTRRPGRGGVDDRLAGRLEPALPERRRRLRDRRRQALLSWSRVHHAVGRARTECRHRTALLGERRTPDDREDDLDRCRNIARQERRHERRLSPCSIHAGRAPHSRWRRSRPVNTSFPYGWFREERAWEIAPPWKRQAICLGLEPSTSATGEGLAAALERDDAPVIEPGAETHTAVELEVTT